MKTNNTNVRFMFAFWGLLLGADSAWALNDSPVENSQGSFFFLVLLAVAVCVIIYLGYSLYKVKKISAIQEGVLVTKNDELLRSVDALSVKNREIQQMLVNKIRETDNWNRDKEAERENLKKRLEEMEKLHNSFFTETIHEMRTPLSLVLGSLSELLQRKMILILVRRLNYYPLTVIPWLFKTLLSSCVILVMVTMWRITSASLDMI